MTTQHDKNIRYLFEPRSLAIIGASGDKGKIGHSVITNVIRNGYKGKIFPINPKGGEIEGLKAYKSILDVNEEIDVAVLTIPAKFAVESIQQCAAKGVKYGMVIYLRFFRNRQRRRRTENGGDRPSKRHAHIGAEYFRHFLRGRLPEFDLCLGRHSLRASGDHYPKRRFGLGHDRPGHGRQRRPVRDCFRGQQIGCGRSRSSGIPHNPGENERHSHVY